MDKKQILITLLVLISGVLYYYSIEGFAITGNVIIQETKVLDIIDGDTIESDLGVVRLLGINTPEKNYPYYVEAKDFLINNVQNKTIELHLIEGNEIGTYGRLPGYVFVNGEFVNKNLLEQGLGHAYFYQQERDLYSNELEDAEEMARKQESGIWEKSSNSECLELIELKFEEPEQLILQNSCDDIEVVIKDNTASHIYKEEIPKGEWIKNFSKVWNNNGDTLFIWDEDGMLILFYRY